MKHYWDGPLPNPQERTIDEIRMVLADQGCSTSRPLYFMYRDLARSERDRAWLVSNAIRYDMTIIPPGLLNGEYVKTKGHYHPPAPSNGAYPELYQVLAGTAHFLLQHRGLDDVAVVSADAGEIVMIPPDYGHVSINPGTEDLVMANLVSTAFESEYGEIEIMHGAAYYEFEGQRWEKNPHYSEVPPIRFLEAGDLNWNQTSGSIYDLIGERETLSCLNHPEELTEYLSVFQRL